MGSRHQLHRTAPHRTCTAQLLFTATVVLAAAASFSTQLLVYLHHCLDRFVSFHQLARLCPCTADFINKESHPRSHTDTACFSKEGKEISTPLDSTRTHTARPPSFPSFLEMIQQQLLLLSLVAVAAAAVAADPQQVQQQQQMRMGMSSRARSLLQLPKPDCPSSCSVRCGNNWNNEMCNVCCNKCGCVPPGTGQETRHICSCYDTMVNPHNPHKLKCP